MLKITRNDATVGAFLLLALVGVIVFFVAKAGQWGLLRGTKRFTIKTPEGRNIKDQAPVRMNGIQIGVVEGIDMDDASNIEIRFRVDQRFGPNIKRDATASIVEPPILGVTYIDIFPGSAGAEESARTGEMPVEERASLEASVDETVRKVEAILKKTDAAVASATRSLDSINLITKDLAEGDGFAKQLIRDQQMAQDLKKIIANAALASEDIVEATGAVRRREGAIGRLLKEDTLVVESEKLIVQARESLKNLDAVTKDLTGSVQLVAKRVDEAGSGVVGLREVIDNTKKLTAEMATLTANINKGKGTVGKFMQDQTVYDESRALIKELRETIQDLREQAPINSFIGVVFSAF